MKYFMLPFWFHLLPSMIYSQTRHLMQGAGTVNMSMGGASTAQPLDIRRALQWNPGSISVFDSKMAQ
jgi:long-chain fatty acid transport protein